ncbi:MAG: carbon-nitrogen hydrolase family protein [Deltaproteobacteria bacterium]|jgi:predicted amidohydrolase|nr:carbon-nitrogen hydrolase family protein [Deltaproteobacteria bacterium]MBW2498828.1 carbon-nitrogen hydrolase family protein [Deltaproteobacteria bacterium]
MAHAVNDPTHPNLVTVGSVNFDSIPRDKPATLARILQFVRDAAGLGCDLVVFPELALNAWSECGDCSSAGHPCGWHLDQAEPIPGPATEAVGALAGELDIHVIFGMEERDQDEPDTIYNSAVLIAPDGLVGTYRKIHLGIPLETNRFTPGDRLPVFETRLGPIGISICYDFYNNPELSRILALKGARLLVNPTASTDLPGKGAMITYTTLVRAQENLVYAISSNRVGDAGDVPWAGNSVIGGPDFPGFGKILAEAGREEQLIVATLDFDQLAAWYDWLPWREWRFGPQRYATEIVAREFAEIADKAGR